MRRAILCVLILLALWCARPATASAQPADKPAIVVRVASINAFLQNINLIVRLAGQDNVAQQIEGVIKSKVGKQGLEGVDPGRPIGAYVRFGAALDDANGVLLLPIINEKAFLALLDNVGVVYTKGKDGVYSHRTNKNVDVYFRFANDYLYITSPRPDAIRDKNLLEPAKALATPSKATISLVAQLDQIPANAKQVALTQLDATIRATKANSPPGVTKAQEALRVVLLHELGKVGANIIKDAGELRFDFDISDKSKDLTINLAITGQPGSDFAKTIKNLGELRSPLAGIGGKDAAFHAAVQLSVPDDLGKLFGAALEDAIAKDLAALQDAELKAQARMVLQAVAPTFKAGEFHSVAALVGPKQDRYALIYALKITDGESLGKLTTDLIKEALATMPKAEKAKYQLDFASVGAIKIHRFDLANDTDDANPLKKLTGDSRLFLAFRKDALFVAVGQDALGVLQSAIANTESAPSVPFVWDVDIARLSPLLAETAEQKALIAKLFPRGQTARIRLSIEGGASLNARLQMQLNVLEFAVKSQQK